MIIVLLSYLHREILYRLNHTVNTDNLNLKYDNVKNKIKNNNYS